ncbi:hypothetical protein [Cobetia amphilecti]|uniref:hypothetical protein n=1 Tax=Cobetia amphilecti TaxID=1055104 RepID=UPI001C08B644|nr:hypothetical protein [Cobetia amphilecti]MBU3007486.1 hypothetical protein [Cobetia amphilecti]
MKDKLQESLIVLSVLKYTMEKDYTVLRRYHNDSDLRFSITNKMLIDISSFLNEWKRFRKYSRDIPEIRDTMKVVRPAIARLNKWHGIEGMRNTMLAHGYRDDNNSGRITCIDKRYFNAKVPKTSLEIMLLIQYCIHVSAIFIFKHGDREPLEDLIQRKNDTEIERGISTPEELKMELVSFCENALKLDPSLEDLLTEYLESVQKSQD